MLLIKWLAFLKQNKFLLKIMNIWGKISQSYWHFFENHNLTIPVQIILKSTF